jgi:hypothetical protein
VSDLSPCRCAQPINPRFLPCDSVTHPFENEFIHRGRQAAERIGVNHVGAAVRENVVVEPEVREGFAICRFREPRCKGLLERGLALNSLAEISAPSLGKMQSLIFSAHDAATVPAEPLSGSPSGSGISAKWRERR